MIFVWTIAAIVLFFAVYTTVRKRNKISRYDEMISSAAIHWVARTLKAEPISGIEAGGPFKLLYVKLIDQNDKTISNPQLKKFLKLLKEHLAEQSLWNSHVFIEVTYEAQGKLRDICEATGVSVDAFQSKSDMVVDFKKEMVRLYIAGKPPEALYSKRKKDFDTI